MRTLHQSLLDRDPAFLEVIARHWGLVLESQEKGEIIEQLKSKMLQREAIATTLADLPTQGREALAALLKAGGHMPAETFTRDYGAIQRMGPGRLRREEPWRQSTNGAESLWYRGLITFGFKLEAPETEVVYIPSDLLTLLPSPQRAEVPFIVAPAPPPEEERKGGNAFRQDVCTFLIYLYREAVRGSHQGKIPLYHQRRLLAVLLERDLDRLQLIEHLARRLGLIAEDNQRLTVNIPRARAWLRASPAHQLRTLQQSWSESPDWNELWRVPGLQCQPTGWKNNPLATRQRVLHWLARCPAEEWLGIESFVQALKIADPEFQRPDGDYDSWYIRDEATGEYLAGFESWEKVEGVLVRDFLRRPLFWLGIVAQGLVQGTPTAFQITPKGKAFLAGEEPPLAQPSPPLTVSPELTIWAPLEGHLYDRFQVARFAQGIPVGENAPPFTYRLTPESLARSREQGITLRQIVAFLKRASGGELPDNVPLLLANWEQKAHKIKLHRAILLQTVDEPTLEELLHLPQTRVYLRGVIGPRAALVAEEEWPRLVQELRKLGYLPKIEGLNRGRPPAR